MQPEPLRAPLAYPAAALSGLLYWLAFAGMDVWPLALIAWVPLVIALRGQPVKRATALGWVAGLTMNVAGFYWLQGMLRTFSGFPAPVCILFMLVVCAYQAGRIGLLGWIYGRAAARGWPAPPVFAAAFAASELVYPLLFPWYYAATVHQVPALVQIADIGGPILVGLVLVAANLAIAEPIAARFERRRASTATIAAGIAAVAVSIAYGVIRIRAVDAAVAAAPAASVGVVQANMGLMEKRTASEEGLRRHMKLTDDVRARGADFVVWSETSATRAVRDDSYKQELRAVVARRIGVPAIFGAVIYRRVDDDRQYVMYNTAISSDAAGAVNSRYDKEYLLTFGEYLPFGDSLPVLYKWSPNSGHFSPGTSLDPLVVDLHGEQHPVTALICYEDILPRFTGHAVAHANPELLVNMTNDAWFGDTSEPWEHLALAKLRAVEHRRYLVRGTNSGVSAVVDPVGRVIAQTSVSHVLGDEREAQAITAPIHWMRSSTVYETISDWPWLLTSVAAALGCFARRRVRAPA